MAMTEALKAELRNFKKPDEIREYEPALSEWRYQLRFDEVDQRLPIE